MRALARCEARSKVLCGAVNGTYRMHAKVVRAPKLPPAAPFDLTECPDGPSEFRLMGHREQWLCADLNL